MITSKLSWLLQLKFKPKPKTKDPEQKQTNKTVTQPINTETGRGGQKRKLFPSFKNIKASLPLSTTMK